MISLSDIQYETGAELINKWYFANFKIYFIIFFQHFRKKNELSAFVSSPLHISPLKQHA